MKLNETYTWLPRMHCREELIPAVSKVVDADGLGWLCCYRSRVLKGRCTGNRHRDQFVNEGVSVWGLRVLLVSQTCLDFIISSHLQLDV